MDVDLFILSRPSISSVTALRLSYSSLVSFDYFGIIPMSYTVEKESILNAYYKKCVDVQDIVKSKTTRTSLGGHYISHVVEEPKDPEALAVDQQLSSLRDMRASLIQSIHALENATTTLGQDSTTIRQVSERFQKYGVVMSVGSDLVHQYNTRVDKEHEKVRLLFIALCILALYIILRRLLWTFTGVSLPGL